MQDLGVLPDGDSSYADDISADGSVVTGNATQPSGSRAFRWTATGGVQNLGVLPGDTVSGYGALSADGLVVAGGSHSPVIGSRLFRWTIEHGLEDLGLPPQVPPRVIYGASAHGEVFVGATRPTSPDNLQRAFLWTESMGLVRLESFLAGLGVDLTGWTLLSAEGVSYDGRAIVGTGLFNGPENYRAFLITGLFKKADYNHDGFIDGLDYDRFFNDFETAQPGVQIRADVNFDWVVDGADADQFMNDLAVGR